MTNVTTFAADSSSGIGALGIDGKALIFQLITFVLAFLVLRRYAFEPILKIMQERRETIESGVKLGEEMQKERAELDKKIAAELKKSRKEADAVIADAQEAGKQAIREAEDKAKAKAQGILDSAHEQIEQDTQVMRKKLVSEVAGWVSDATEAIIDEKVDAKKDAKLIDAALKGAR